MLDITGFHRISSERCSGHDLLTPYDLRAQNFRVNVEFSTQHRGRNFISKKCPKVNVLFRSFLELSRFNLMIRFELY